tara:strand:+ start:106 stop:570 length:465 start_codon:yes stop_codon:yes gene_type:complete
MTRYNLFIYGIMLSVLMLLVSCTSNNSTSTEGNTSQVADVKIPQTEIETEEKTIEAATNTITAKFVRFSLGDASHFVFEDEAGLKWDFGGCESEKFTFERELEESEFTEFDQGWGSNKDLQGKWFVLGYEEIEEPLYIDGPIGKVKIITKVEFK